MGNWGGVRDILTELVGKDEDSKRYDAEIKLYDAEINQLAQQQINREHVENKYVFARFFIILYILTSWILLIGGVALAVNLPYPNVYSFAIAIGMASLGLMGVFMQSNFDIANNTREILFFLRNYQEERSQIQSRQE